MSPRRMIPAHIPRPDYAETGKPKSEGVTAARTPEELTRMRRACTAAAQVLANACQAVRPGVTTDEIDAIVHAECIRLGGYPSSLNYYGFPKSLCTSVNEVICHGIPDSRPLQAGDIVNVDVAIYLDGMHGDCSRMCAVGKIDRGAARLIRVTEECLHLGIAAVKPDRPVRDIGRAIETHARRHGLGVVTAFYGHGIGPALHLSPMVPHFFQPSALDRMEPGMTLTIEPMLNEGSWCHRIQEDGFTAVTVDGKRSAQAEHTVLVTGTGAEILTV
ncbi:MAG: type I methionyl aminopeptidase [Myxococcaceae bacterium]